MKEKLPRIIRWQGLRKMFDDDISRSTIDRWIRLDLFPKKIQLGKNSVGWNLSEVENWFKSKNSN